MPRWVFFVLIAVIIALVIVVVILAVTSCSHIEEEETQKPVMTAYAGPYNWDDLATDANGLHTYSIDGVVVSEAGVDVSAYDGVIDWEAVAASGIDFAMVRVGYRGYGSAGSMNLDEYFFDNIRGAKDAGLKVGAYFFSQAITEEEAIEEAQFVIDYLDQAGVELDYPVAFDEEPITNGDIARTDGLSNEQFTACALAYCTTIEDAGYTAIIYGNQYDLSKFDLTGALGAYDVWLAEYAAQPTAQTGFIMWQYTENGTVNGIPTTEGWVDLNIRFVTK